MTSRFLLCLFVVLSCMLPVQAERSLLYPADWTPGFGDGDGRFLHDFSYAGYRNGENLPTADMLGQRFNVVAEFGADSSGKTDATAAIQSAIDAAAAAGGGVVFFPAGLYRCEGSLQIKNSGIVLSGECSSNTFVYFTTCFAGSGHAHISFSGAVKQLNATPLAADGQALSFEVCVSDASAFQVGDDVTVGWTITDDFVAEHGMTGTWKAFNGQWQPFFQRRIVAIDRESVPQVVTLDVPLRYVARTRDHAVLTRTEGYLSECGVMHLAVSDAIDRDSA
jgi:hypothetical protein